MERRTFILALGATALAGCDEGVPTADRRTREPVYGTGVVKPSDPAPTYSPGPPASSYADMKLTDVRIQVNRGMGRPFQYGGFSPDHVHSVLASKLRSVINAANPGGTRAARAEVKLSSITIATKGGRKPAYDSVIIASATFFDVATGAQIGGRENLGAQASYRPAFLGGQDRVLSPQQELELITTHSVSALARKIYG